MTDATTKINALLRVAAKDSGASAHEAHTAASCAVNLARKNGLGHLTARALNVQAKAARRVERDDEKAELEAGVPVVEIPADGKVVNPLYDLWLQTHPDAKSGGWALRDYQDRQKAVRLYAWAIPNEEALEAIIACGPVVEIGAGSGYWASLLTQMGGDVVAFDAYAPKANSEYGFEQGWFDVRRGGPEKAAEHADRALFLCWPNYDTSFAADCLKAYMAAGGETVIFVGEGWGGCTADNEFFNILGHGYSDWDDDGNEVEPDLGDEWEEVKDVGIPQWDGIHDYLTIYRRKSKKTLS